MFLTRRRILVWVLLLAAAAGWIYGRAAIHSSYGELGATSTTAPPGTFFFEEAEPATQASEFLPEENTQRENRSSRAAGYLLCAAGGICALIAIGVFSQKAPFLGPDILCALGAVYVWLWHTYVRGYGSLPGLFYGKSVQILLLLGLLHCLRELWGWLLQSCPSRWSLVCRLASRWPQLAMMIFALWTTAAVAGIALIIHGGAWAAVGLLTAFGAFGLLGLWSYGRDIQHFRQQLDRFQKGEEISVKEGAFAGTETQLKQVQHQHREAIQTAVTSERFKVELISNVSHDLRTPLTSILGYSELLKKQVLTQEGRTQLDRLHQKAGYMHELVESLFELTKVSSGAVESQKRQIDLIRLLEQTIGLFDDQLTAASLTLRRSYEADSVPLITDGARMHQVFANLLGNAIKYALAGTRIHLTVKQREDVWVIRMVNTACYEMDFREEEILQRFARGDKARSTQGSGLGLAIAQTYTESVGGKFHIHVDGDQFSAVVELPKP